MEHGPQLSRPLTQHHPYVPGKQPEISDGTVKLNTNENPYPPSPQIKNAILGELESLRLYPNSSSNDLRVGIAKLHELKASQVIVGNGSDDLLNLCTRCFSDEKLKVGMLEPSYSLYEVVASLQGSSLIRIPFDDDAFTITPKSIVDSGANLFFITSPHAPSGQEYSMDCFRHILSEFKGVVVIDEAYADFAGQNALSLLDDYPNLIITRTMSKSYSLAGLRVGYALSSPEIISILDQAREVYNVDRLAQAAALASLNDRSYFEETLTLIVKERRKLAMVLDEWGWKSCPSGANFIFTRPIDFKGESGPEVASDLYDYLSSRNVLTRYFPQHELTSSYVRISIGNSRDMDILLERIIEWKTQEQP